MRILVLGILLLTVWVSGHDVTIHGFLGQEVLLPCNCTNVNLTRGFRWQNGNKIVFQYESKSSKREVDRITTFVKDDRNNCSILLANITAEDQGSYRCCFFTQDEDAYERFFLSLKISAKFDVCQKKLSDQRFQCDVEGLYEGAEILWHLDGRPLTNSSTVKIINNSTKDAQLHRFKSELRSNSNITSNLTCSVRTGNMPLNITAHCKEPERRTNPPEQRNDRKYFLTIPFFLVLILLAAIAFKYSRPPQKREILLTQDPTPENVDGTDCNESMFIHTPHLVGQSSCRTAITAALR